MRVKVKEVSCVSGSPPLLLHLSICFTICLFISPDIDGYRAPKGINDVINPTKTHMDIDGEWNLQAIAAGQQKSHTCSRFFCPGEKFLVFLLRGSRGGGLPSGQTSVLNINKGGAHVERGGG